MLTHNITNKTMENETKHGSTIPDPCRRPERVQRSRKAGWRMPGNTISVCRPGMWGNPFGVNPADGGQETAVMLYEEWLLGDWPNTEPERRDWILKNLHTLRGKNLACWCRSGTPCHADVLLDLANAEASCGQTTSESPPCSDCSDYKSMITKLRGQLTMALGALAEMHAAEIKRGRGA